MKGFMKTITTLVIGMMLGAATISAAAPSTVQAVITNLKIIVNGEEQKLANSPVVVNGTTYLPVRDTAGIFDADIQYDGQNKQIRIQSKGEEAMTTQTHEWLTIREIVEINKRSTGIGETNSHVVLKDDNGPVLVIPTQDVTASGIELVDVNGNIIKAKLIEGRVFLNAYDLKAAGII